jgi:hypothetical protein
MTTSIITNLLGPICELYYKYEKAMEIQSANINTLRNYGFSTSFALNYGFEIYEPFDVNNIKLQPGVFTYNNTYNVLPNLDSSTTINIQKLIIISKSRTFSSLLLYNHDGHSLGDGQIRALAQLHKKPLSLKLNKIFRIYIF